MASIDAHWLLIPFLLWRNEVSSNTSVPILIVPVAGNCGEVSILICKTHLYLADVCRNATIRWDKDKDYLIRNGESVKLVDKYREVCDDTNLALQIKDTTFSDEGEYRCAINFDVSNYTLLRVQCRASTNHTNARITSKNRLNIFVDKLYPGRPLINVSALPYKESNAAIEGQQYCLPSADFINCSTCVWESFNSLVDGDYNISINVTTITPSDPIVKHVQVGEDIKIHLVPNNTMYRVEEYTSLKDIECAAECKPGCNYSWTKVEQAIVLTHNSTLSIGSALRASNGTYRCTAQSAFRSKSTEIITEILYGPESILLYPKETSYIVNEGDVLPTIICSATCSPTCEYIWRKEGENDTIGHDGNLMLRNIKEHMEGRYKCTVINRARNVSVALNETIHVVIRSGSNVKQDGSVRNAVIAVSVVIICLSVASCSVVFKKKSTGHFCNVSATEQKKDVTKEFKTLSKQRYFDDYFVPVGSHIYDEIRTSGTVESLKPAVTGVYEQFRELAS